MYYKECVAIIMNLNFFLSAYRLPLDLFDSAIDFILEKEWNESESNDALKIITKHSSQISTQIFLMNSFVLQMVHIFYSPSALPKLIKHMLRVLSVMRILFCIFFVVFFLFWFSQIIALFIFHCAIAFSLK